MYVSKLVLNYVRSSEHILAQNVTAEDYAV